MGKYDDLIGSCEIKISVSDVLAEQEALNKAAQKVCELAGEEFDVDSERQLARILYDKLGLPPVKKTAAGYSTDTETLEKLQGKHPIIDAILEYRSKG